MAYEGTINDDDREKRVLNDEGLYNDYKLWSKENKRGMRPYIRENRKAIDRVIRGEAG